MIIPNNTEELLTGILKTLALEIRGKVCVGYQKILLDTVTPKRFTLPSGAITAEVTLEIANAATPCAVGARYTLNGTVPQAGTSPDKEGVPIGDADTIEIRGGDNLAAFQVIDSGAGSNTRYLKVQYFK